MLRCYELAVVVGISKTTYVLATPRCLVWRRAPQTTSTNNDPSDSDSLDPFRREVYRDGRYVALTRKQFAVLEVLVAAEGGVVSAEELLARAWDENADPFTNAVRITVSALRKRLGEPWIIATVAGAGYRISTQPDTGPEGGDRG
jgi:DNA-binding response OmpR family regulator